MLCSNGRRANEAAPTWSPRAIWTRRGRDVYHEGHGRAATFASTGSARYSARMWPISRLQRRALAMLAFAAAALALAAASLAHEPDESPPRAAFTAPPTDAEHAGLLAERAPIPGADPDAVELGQDL